MSKGANNYRMWHDKEPSRVTEVSVKQLNEKYACAVGIGYQIGYSSAKWEKKAFQYIHDFGTPRVYFLESLTKPGESMGKKTVVSLVCGRFKEQTPEMTFMGTVDELTYKDKTGEIVSVTGISGAKLLGTPDNKGLLILHRKGPIFVRGGKMRIEARGIVD